jgi:hypothetical protein
MNNYCFGGEKIDVKKLSVNFLEKVQKLVSLPTILSWQSKRPLQCLPRGSKLVFVNRDMGQTNEHAAAPLQRVSCMGR